MFRVSMDGHKNTIWRYKYVFLLRHTWTSFLVTLICLCLCLSLYIYIYIYICVCVCVCVRVGVYIYIYIHTYVYMCVQTHSHTHTHIYINIYILFYLFSVPPPDKYGTRPFLKWVRTQSRNPHASGKIPKYLRPRRHSPYGGDSDAMKQNSKAIYIYILSSTDRLFCCITTLQCG